MGEFIVELYVADAAAADRFVVSARVGAEQLSGEGTSIRCVRSIFVPEDETCFLLFEAASAEAVLAAAERARLPIGHVSEAFAGSIRKEAEL